jgi:hypothetical protein
VCEVVAHGPVTQFEERGARKRRGCLELLVGVRAGVEVDACDARVPAALATVFACNLLDEAVLREGSQVVTAR